MATRFRFRLEPLLKLRKSMEQEAQRHLARMIEARNQAEAHLESMEQRQAECVASRTYLPGAAVDVASWKDLERFLVVLERHIAEGKTALASAEQLVVGAREALTRAHQAHLTLLRLKERRAEQHALDLLHEETREADEMAVLRHAFRM